VSCRRTGPAQKPRKASRRSCSAGIGRWPERAPSPPATAFANAPDHESGALPGSRARRTGSGSLLLFGGRLGDLIGRKITFLVGLLGFAGASAVGGAATSFTTLVAARACQGAFGALLAPAALALLTTTFSDSKERGRAFGVKILTGKP
jgi:hypothetical protein